MPTDMLRLGMQGKAPKTVPTKADMQISLEDARFFCERIDEIVRGQSEQQQDLEVVRRYFRAYLHCWKCILYYVRAVRGREDNNEQWSARMNKWETSRGLSDDDARIWKLLRESRDQDTHKRAIKVDREIALGLFPLVMIEHDDGRRRELILCCERGLVLARWLIADYDGI